MVGFWSVSCPQFVDRNSDSPSIIAVLFYPYVVTSAAVSKFPLLLFP